MKNSKALFLDLVNQIKLVESQDEVRSIVYLVLDNLFSISRTDILSEKEVKLGQTEEKKIIEIIRRINNHEPIQYILGEVEFYGRRFIVNSSVLIPRPETEELVRSIITDVNSVLTTDRIFRILDIGTGSGCIPVTLALEIPGAEVSATDISDPSIEVARENALRLNANVRFFKNDILEDEIPFRDLDIVVSNPPYITWSEKQGLKKNVLAFEPYLALFVPDDDPLLFYRVIAEKAPHLLRSNGMLAVEINERFGNEVAALLKVNGFAEVQVLKDLFGKERIVKGTLP